MSQSGRELPAARALTWPGTVSAHERKADVEVLTLNARRDFRYRPETGHSSAFRAFHLGTPRGRKWWKVIGRFAFNAAFVAEVDDLLSRTERSTYLIEMRRWDDARQ